MPVLSSLQPVAVSTIRPASVTAGTVVRRSRMVSDRAVCGIFSETMPPGFSGRGGRQSDWALMGTTNGPDQRPLVEQVLAATSRSDVEIRELTDTWLTMARSVADLPADEPWPAWSAGEVLAVALILDDAQRLQILGYTADQAVDRLRFDLQLPTVVEAAQRFAELRTRL